MNHLPKRDPLGFIGLCVIASFVWLAGCGKASYEFETAAVSGTVKIDGQPLSSGYVYVLADKGRMAKGIIQEDGSFVLGTYDQTDGAQVGTHPVIVVPVPTDEGTRKPDSSSMRIPKKYSNARTSGLSVTVKPGDENQLVLDLQTD